MEQRRTPAGLVRNIIVAAAIQGTTLNTLAKATDMGGSTLRERLDESSDFTWDELTHVGGLFSIHPATLLAGA